MSPTRLCSLVFALGCATLLSSCEMFRKDPPQQAETYDAANAYNTASGTAPAAATTYGTPGAYDAGNAYTQPNAYAPPNTAGQPYTQPPYTPPPTGAGYAGGYDTGAYQSPATGGAPTGSGRTHKVVRGDTLSGISRRYGVGMSDLMRANNLNSDLIREGQKLNIP